MTKIKLYYDKNINIINDDYNYKIILYSTYLNKFIRINQLTYDIIVKSINKEKGKNYLIIEDKKLAQILLDSKLFFYSKKEYKKNSFKKVYEKLNSKIALKTAYIHLTHRCNLSCVYCYNKNILNNSKNELNENEWKIVIDKLKKIEIKNFIFTGGEPLLNENITNIIEYTKSTDNKVELITNGTLLNGKFNKLLNLVDIINISLDHIDKEKNSITRRGSEKYNILDYILSMPENIKSKINIKMVITKYNQKELQDIKKYFKIMDFLFLQQFLFLIILVKLKKFLILIL